jgi:hypothetical protein
VDPVTIDQILLFLETAGKRLPVPATILVYGGSALLLIGGRRNTVDLDYALESPVAEQCRPIISAAAAELGLEIEENVPSGFMPLPGGAEARHRLIGRYNLLTAYVLDPYSMAVMKVDRAFPSDIEDVQFLLKNGHVKLGLLERSIEEVSQRYDEPMKLRRNWEALKRSLW